LKLRDKLGLLKLHPIDKIAQIVETNLLFDAAKIG